jgi:hypothetical protein
MFSISLRIVSMVLGSTPNFFLSMIFTACIRQKKINYNKQTYRQLRRQFGSENGLTHPFRARRDVRTEPRDTERTRLAQLLAKCVLRRNRISCFAK